MKKIKSIIILSIVFVISTAFIKNEFVNPEPKAKELKWYTNFEEARVLANKENKVVFGFFTGSDWCGWCRKLKSNVFDKKAFIEWADENVILLELDFPRRTKLSEELQQQNYGLANVFKVRGYPTVWLFDGVVNKETKQVELKAYGSAGYPSGTIPGKEELKFIADMNEILKKKQ